MRFSVSGSHGRGRTRRLTLKPFSGLQCISPYYLIQLCKSVDRKSVDINNGYDTLTAGIYSVILRHMRWLLPSSFQV